MTDPRSRSTFRHLCTLGRRNRIETGNELGVSVTRATMAVNVPRAIYCCEHLTWHVRKVLKRNANVGPFERNFVYSLLTGDGKRRNVTSDVVKYVLFRFRRLHNTDSIAIGHRTCSFMVECVNIDWAREYGTPGKRVGTYRCVCVRTIPSR